MRIPRLFSIASLTLLAAAPFTAVAQDEEGGAPADSAAETPPDDAPAAATDDAAATTAAPAAATAAPPADPVSEPFQIRRGLHAELDLGVFFTFGGINTNSENFLAYDPPNGNVAPLPTKGISNVQPLLAFFLGYDLAHTEKYSLAAGVRLGAAYSGGASRVKKDDVDQTAPNSDARKTLATRANDFGVLTTGVGLSFGYLLSERIALTVKANGGLAIIGPDPAATAGEDAGGSSAFSGAVGGGLGMEYFTLLNDFSVGLDAQFTMIFAAGGIPSLGLSIPVKYTF